MTANESSTTVQGSMPLPAGRTCCTRNAASFSPSQESTAGDANGSHRHLGRSSPQDGQHDVIVGCSGAMTHTQCCWEGAGVAEIAEAIRLARSEELRQARYFRALRNEWQALRVDSPVSACTAPTKDQNGVT